MRFEHKYLIPNYLLSDVRASIAPYVGVDPYAARMPDNQYTVRSIYFDSPDLVSYHEKEAGIKNRKKLRIRGYNELGSDERVFLEIKRKTNMLVSKNRAMVNFADLERIFRAGAPSGFVISNGTTDEDARKFFYHFYRQSMRPIETVIYEREPYFCRFGSTMRITFDINLRSVLFPRLDELFSEEHVVPAFPNHFILEVKFDAGRGYPRWVRPFIARYDLKKQALSKYCICLDTHDVVPRGRREVLGAAPIVTG